LRPRNPPRIPSRTRKKRRAPTRTRLRPRSRPRRRWPNKLKQIERAWADAEIKHDPSLVAPYIADSIVKIGDDNQPIGHDQLLDRIKNSDATIGSIDLPDMKVQVYGTAAVVSGVFKASGASKGKNFTNSGRFTDTFVQQDGEWKAVASHDSLDR